MEELYLEQEIFLRTTDFDSKDRIKQSALLDIFQDVAGVHATEIGVGFEDTYKKGFFWVLLRNIVEVVGEIKPLTKLKLCTWPHIPGRIDYDREYALCDMDNNILAKGVSKWVIIDINTRRVARADNLKFKEGYYHEDNNYIEIKKVTLPDESLFELKSNYTVLRRDIDHNLHMNNTKYADLIFDVLNDEDFIIKLEMEFIKEVKLGDSISLYEYKDNKNLYYIGYKQNEKLFYAKCIKE